MAETDVGLTHQSRECLVLTNFSTSRAIPSRGVQGARKRVLQFFARRAILSLRRSVSRCSIALPPIFPVMLTPHPRPSSSIPTDLLLGLIRF